MLKNSRMNKIYKSLLKNKIDQFVVDFKSSRELFENLDKRNKLLHPGEFGMFRENICDDLIRFTIPSKYKTGTGFLINSYDEISSQCDIVIYDFNNTPLIQDGSDNRFFPVEPVIGIGEIKSKLTRKMLCDALIKLAKNKSIKKINPNQVFCVNKPNNLAFNPSVNCYDTMFSFLICEEVENFDYNKLEEEINIAYENNNIDYEYRHNIILSLQNGVLIYQNQYSDLHSSIPENQIMNIPKALDKKFKNYYSNINTNENIILLLTSLSNFLVNVNIYYPEPNAYN